MQWIDKMLSSTRVNKVAESTKRRAKHQKGGAPVDAEKQTAAARGAWSKLLSAIRNDVADFNNSKSRAGHSPVLMTDDTSSPKQFQFEVYVPEMNSKMLVLNLAGNSIHSEVRPEYPDQQGTITWETGKNTKDDCWVLDGVGETRRGVTVQQLSEFLLTPILSSADID
jgi:hypothetical protein